MLCLENCLPPFLNYLVLLRMDEWRNTVRNAVPEAIVELLCCKSKKECKTNACGCKKVGLTVLMLVYVTRRKNEKTKMIIIVMIEVTMRSSSCNTCD